MTRISGLRGLVVVLAAGVLAAAAPPARAAVAPAFRPIDPTMAGQTITLTGRDMTIDQVVRIARYGAKVSLSPEAKKRQSDAFGLILQASAEGIPVYGFNRGSGSGREVTLFKGDPTAPENVAYITQRLNEFYREGPRLGIGPEVSEEEIVRALMAVRANTMTYESASPAMSQLLVDMLNTRVAPVVQSRGSLGEADLAQVKNVLGTMGGEGEAYFQGRRMSAREALAAAGLKPLQPMEAIYTSSLTSTNAYSVGQAALLVADARHALDWADLTYAMDLNALNSSVTPLSTPVQAHRPFKWSNLDAARIMDMIRDSYLFADDPTRIIQDPESMRAGYSRQGAAWKAWATLRDTVLLQINSSDHNPATIVGAKPTDSWELSTPQMMKFYVKGGPLSHGLSGYVFSNALWDPYPLANEVEAFTNALANMDVAVAQRIYRFGNPFFTVASPKDLLTPRQLADAAPNGIGYDPTAIWQEIQSLAPSLTPEGNASVSDTVEELQAQTVLKVQRSRAAVDATLRLLGLDLMTATYWMDLRAIQSPARKFGTGPTAAWQAFRKVVPWQMPSDQRPRSPESGLGYAFVASNPVSVFYPAAARDIDGGKPDGRP